MGRVIAGFFFAPFFGSVLFSVAFRSFDFGALALIVVYPVALLFGLPMFFLFRWRGWLQWWQVSLGGALCAMPFVTTYFAGANQMHVERYGLTNAAVLIGCGATISLIFWGIAIAGNRALTLVGADTPAARRST